MKHFISELLSLPRNIVRILFAYDIFISYAHKDGAAYAKALDNTLLQTFTTHLDERDFLAGQDLNLLTRLRLRRSRLLVVVARFHALQSSYWVRQEVDTFAETGREPIIVDVGGAVESALEDPQPDRLSERLAALVHVAEDGQVIIPVLRINDTAPDDGLDRVPSLHVAGEIGARFTGDRVEKRRYRIVLATLALMLVLTLAAVFTAYQSVLSERRARAEALGSGALVAASGRDLTDGFLLDAADRLVRAYALDATSGVLSVSAKVETMLPSGIMYPSQNFEPLGPLAAGEDVVYAREGNHTILALKPSDLKVVDRWPAEDLGLISIGNVIPQPGGFVALTAREAVSVSSGETRTIELSGWYAAVRPGSGFAARGSGNNALTFVDDTGTVSEPPCPLPEISVAWHDFLSRDQLVLAGRSGSSDLLAVLDLASCGIQTEILRDQPLGGVTIPQVGRIAIRGQQSVVVFDAALRDRQTATISDPSAIAVLEGDVPGFAVGTQSGSIELFSILSDGTLFRGDALEKVLPGTVEGLAHDPTSKRLIASGRRGYFVDSSLPGAIVSLPLVAAQKPVNSGTAWVNTLGRRGPNIVTSGIGGSSRIGPSQSLRDRLILGHEDGSLSLLQDGRLSDLPIPGGPIPDGFQITGLTAFGDTYYVGFGNDGAGLVVGISETGQEILRKSLDGMPTKLAANGSGIIVQLQSDERTVRDGVTYQRLRNYGTNGTEAHFEVANLNANSGHGTVTIDPTGRTAAFARFDGFEFRPLNLIDQPSDCVVRPDPEDPAAAGVAAAFSANGNGVVLGTWNGILSVWTRSGTCWQLDKRLETSVGRMISTLLYDDEIVLGRSLSDPPLLRLWDASTGVEIGSGYSVDARAMRVIRPGSRLNRWASWLRFFNDFGPAEIIVEYVSEQEIGRLDLSSDAVINRLCRTLKPALQSGLVPASGGTHPCELVEVP